MRTAEGDVFINVNTSDRVVRREKLTEYDCVVLEVLEWITTFGRQGGSWFRPCGRIGESFLDIFRYGDTIEVPFGIEGGTQKHVEIS